MPKRIIKSFAIYLILICFVFSQSTCFSYALNEWTNSDVYQVTTRANLRETPSQNGKWIYTVPTGVLVALLDDESDNSYCYVQYGNYEGYIYSACIKEATDKSYEDYVNQFPELFEPASSQTSVTMFDYSNIIYPSAVADETAVDPLGTTTGSADSLYSRGYVSLGGLLNGGAGISTEMLNRATLITGNVTTRAKLREAPSVESQQITVVPVGEEITIVDNGENGYAHVLYGDYEGYVYARCIEYDSELVGNVGSGITDTVVVDAILNSATGISAAMDMSGSIASERRAIAAIAAGALTQNMPEVEDEDVIIEEELEELAAVNPGSVGSTSDSVAEMAGNVISRAVNLRSLPDQASNRITTIPSGANVTVLGSTQGGYTMVQYNGITGYVLEDCVVDSSSVYTASASTATTPVNTYSNLPSNSASAVVENASGGILFTCTAYCSCRICCGVYSPEVTGKEAHTATGTVPEEGRTIAVDPSVIPYGTSVYIEGMGTYVAEDCGGAVKGNHIDIYFASHDAALQFGTRRLYVYIGMEEAPTE